VDRKGEKGQHTKQGKMRRQQLVAGVGASRRLHMPSSRPGSWLSPSSFRVLLSARQGSSIARNMRCREATLPPAHLCESAKEAGHAQGGGTVQQEGPSQPAIVRARQGGTCTAHVGAGGSSAGSQAG